RSGAVVLAHGSLQRSNERTSHPGELMNQKTERVSPARCSGRLRPSLIACSFVIGAGTLAGCGDVDLADNGGDPRFERMSDELVGYSPGYWTSSPNAASPTIISVCFENPTAADASFRQNVQNAVSQSW